MTSTERPATPMRRRTSRLLPAINTALAPFTLRRDPDRFMHRLLERHGIIEAADPAFIDDMRYLLDQVAAVPNLSALGWQSFTGDIGARLVNRERVRRLHTTHPDVGHERIAAPIIVVGLPRTATTLTHHILAGAEGVRGPLLWEWMHTDLPMEPRAERAVIRQVEAAMRMMAFLTPAMIDIHLPEARKPDECAFFLPHTEGHLARAPMPEYEQWLGTRDFSADYAFLKQGLQVLQHRRDEARWVLKCPTHLGHLDLLMEQFPDATIVWTHRDPVTVVASICSLVETSRAMHLRPLDTEDLHDIGRMAVATMSSLVDRGRTARTRIPRGQIIDLPYPKLTADPPGEIQSLYYALGLPWTGRDEMRVLEAERRGPGRRHEYTLDRYGLDEAFVNAAFGNYGNLADLPGLGGT
ncbi:sulfotransferase [Glycomyces sp. A-F 0318]|uniref:sulfotransferase family protein n=1 Tax=Glycomyces amatae TaxID=2881355 RepID=UPI001E4485B0|nr:sulfotransferase [Glycomyces amatae]MCD0444268.1 sulfotransferase [Glycomyces amatae]